jgi:hypothetical protein
VEKLQLQRCTHAHEHTATGPEGHGFSRATNPPVTIPIPSGVPRSLIAWDLDKGPTNQPSWK